MSIFKKFGNSIHNSLEIAQLALPNDYVPPSQLIQAPLVFIIPDMITF